MILTNIGRIGIYKMNELIKIIDLNLDKTREQKLIILNDGLTSHYFKILNLNTLDFYQISSNLSNKNKIDLYKINQNVDMIDKILIYLAELDAVLALDKNLKDFTMYSYSKKNQYSNNIKFINNKDETLIRKFFNLFGMSKFKYKILHNDNFQIYFAITALKPNNQQVHSSLILKSTFITSINDKNNSDIEFLIIKTFPFCNCYEFKMIKNDLVFSFNYLMNLDFDLALDKNSYHSIKTNRDTHLNDNYISIYNLKNNHKIFELNVKLLNANIIVNNDEIIDEIVIKLIAIDSTKTYLTFFDNKKYLWLYKISTSNRLACLSLYGIASQIKFTDDNMFVCLNMNDRRIYSLLIVDPEVHEHEMRIKNLFSRQLNRKRNTRQIKDLIKKKEPLIKMISRKNTNEKILTNNNAKIKSIEERDEDKISILNKLADDLNSSEYEIDSSTNDSSIDTNDEIDEQMVEEQRIISKNMLSRNIKKSNSMQKNISIVSEEKEYKTEKKINESMFNLLLYYS
jgi:hypothetical protein